MAGSLSEVNVWSPDMVDSVGTIDDRSLATIISEMTLI